MIEINPQISLLEASLGDSALTQIVDPLLIEYNVELWVKRDDLMHSVISGNKWRKLKYILNDALSLQAHRLVSMGGVYSNHLHVLAYAGKQLGLKTLGVIRGEPPRQMNQTLRDLQHWGMHLEFVSRDEFRKLRQFKRHDDLPAQQYQGYWIAEGGSSILALEGVAELATEINLSFDMVCLPCGTGTTMAGLLASLTNVDQVLGFAALKGAGFLTEEIVSILREAKKNANVNWEINQDYHFGGFARSNEQLLTFIDDFYKTTAIPLEPIYTGKMFYGIYDLIKQGQIPKGQKILAIHTGGLQGARGA